MISETRKIAPSILSADFSSFGSAVQLIQDAGADLVHIDIMDGNFVPNLTFGPKLIEDIKPKTSLPLDVHLMVINPEQYVEQMAHAGADFFTFHQEASTHAHRLVQRIRETGMKPGISIVPSTPVSTLESILEYVDLVLIMTVNPGFGGQKLIHSCLAKIEQLKSIREKKNYTYEISMDGGASIDNRNLLWQAGADIIVTGSSFFFSENKVEFVKMMKS
jgi:ribulose-phosphate 3-epimerase